VNWRQFLKSYKTVLLTLPGAVLWSLPVGCWAMPTVQRVLPIVAPLDELFKFALILGLILVPVSAVCSGFALKLSLENRDGYNRSTAFLLALFNLANGSVSYAGTMLLVTGLLFRLAAALSG
jgi:hypothetical protein